VEPDVRIFSYGGGVQSTAVLALQAMGELPEPYDYFVFANVGDDSENPDTLHYLEAVAKPYAARHGIEIVETQKRLRDGTLDTLKSLIYRTKRSVPIPAFMSNGAPGNRSCTIDFKIKVVDKWLKDNGYLNAVVGLGISTDEFGRVRDRQWHDGAYARLKKKRDYPLIDLGLSRSECRKIIYRAGLPYPPKSSCWFCPFKRAAEWIEFKRDYPELFKEAIEIDEHINEKRQAIVNDRVYLHVSCTPLRNAVADQLPLWDLNELDKCESGYCFV
jgi:hypothetical protein